MKIFLLSHWDDLFFEDKNFLFSISPGLKLLLEHPHLNLLPRRWILGDVNFTEAALSKLFGVFEDFKIVFIISHLLLHKSLAIISYFTNSL